MRVKIVNKNTHRSQILEIDNITLSKQGQLLIAQGERILIGSKTIFDTDFKMLMDDLIRTGWTEQTAETERFGLFSDIDSRNREAFDR